MERPSELVIVRHAESLRNQIKAGSRYFNDEYDRKPLMGIADHDIKLTLKGHEQALQTGVALRERYGNFDYAYTSGYLRTDQTLDGILKAYTEEDLANLQRRQNAFIRERDPGYTYDMTTEEAETAFPWLQRYWETFGGYMARPPGGESLADVSERVYTFLGMLFRDRVGQRVLVVTHGGTIRCFRQLLEHWNYAQATNFNSEQHPLNCGVTTYDSREAGRLVLKGYNEVFYNNDLISKN